jgi:hypothetical protein
MGDRHIWTQGCQMVCFQTKIPNLGKFWKVLQWKRLVYFMDIWSILLSFSIFYEHLVYFVEIWYIFPVLVFRTKKNLATLSGHRSGCMCTYKDHFDFFSRKHNVTRRQLCCNPFITSVDIKKNFI